MLQIGWTKSGHCGLSRYQSPQQAVMRPVPALCSNRLRHNLYCYVPKTISLLCYYLYSFLLPSTCYVRVTRITRGSQDQRLPSLSKRRFCLNFPYSRSPSDQEGSTTAVNPLQPTPPTQSHNSIRRQQSGLEPSGFLLPNHIHLDQLHRLHFAQ